MSHYRFKAARADGTLVSGLVPAADLTRATADLLARGLHPVALEYAATTRARTAGRRELAILFQSVSALVSAGVPLERAVAASANVTRGTLRECLGQVQKDLREGLTLASALDRTRGIVPGVVIGMVRAGERGSQLASALRQVAAQLEDEADLVARVRNALAYPAILSVAGLISVGVITTVVLPRFAALLAEMGDDLPPATRLLLNLSGLVSRFGVWFGLAVLIAGFSLLAWTQQSAGRAWFHRTLIGIPVVGPLRHSLATARVCRALGAMLESGMPLLSALDAAGEAAGDAAVRQRLDGARERVARGEPLTTSLTHESALTHSALQLVAVGEGSAQVGTMATKAGDLAAQEADRGLRTMVTILEPALVITFGGLVAFVAAALLQAVYGLRPM